MNGTILIIDVLGIIRFRLKYNFRLWGTALLLLFVAGGIGVILHAGPITLKISVAW